MVKVSWTANAQPVRSVLISLMELVWLATSSELEMGLGRSINTDAPITTTTATATSTQGRLYQTALVGGRPAPDIVDGSKGVEGRGVSSLMMGSERGQLRMRPPPGRTVGCPRG